MAFLIERTYTVELDLLIFADLCPDMRRFLEAVQTHNSLLKTCPLGTTNKGYRKSSIRRFKSPYAKSKLEWEVVSSEFLILNS